MSRIPVRAAVAAVLCLILISLVPVSASARDPRRDPGLRPHRPALDEPPEGLEAQALQASAAVDTYCIVWFDFEVMDWQGWTKDDNSAQRGVFFHVDDFSGLGGGTYGGLAAIEGIKSMWCGARPGSDWYLCSWLAAPGYGNGWDQTLVAIVGYTGVLTLSYHAVFDSEPKWDKTIVSYERFGEEVTLAEYDGTGDLVASHDIRTSTASTKLRFRFTSDGAWSDEDGLRDSDGAFIVDSITVSDDDGPIDFEDFEASSVGATEAGIWSAYAGDAFGSYALLANNLLDSDPCNDNNGTLVAFFDVSGPYPEPGLPATPFCKGPGGISAPCQDEEIVSPPIDLTRYSTSCDDNQDADIPPSALPGLGGVELRFSAYYDLPLENLVFATWRFRSIENGCPDEWREYALVMYQPRGWTFERHDISGGLDADTMQVAVGVVDMCDAWYPQYGNCADHTSAPWYDNVALRAYVTLAPNTGRQALEALPNLPDRFGTSVACELVEVPEMPVDAAGHVDVGQL